MRVRWIFLVLAVVLGSTIIAVVEPSGGVLVGADRSAAADQPHSTRPAPDGFERSLAVATDRAADPDGITYVEWVILSALIALIALVRLPGWHHEHADTRYAALAAWAHQGTPTRGPPAR